MYKIEHKGLDISFDVPDLRQRHIEEFFKNLRELQGGQIRLSSPELVGCTVRSAIMCGWLEGLPLKDVDEMLPGKATWLSGKIQDILAKLQEVPGE